MQPLWRTRKICTFGHSCSVQLNFGTNQVSAVLSKHVSKLGRRLVEFRQKHLILFLQDVFVGSLLFQEFVRKYSAKKFTANPTICDHASIGLLHYYISLSFKHSIVGLWAPFFESIITHRRLDFHTNLM